MPRDAQGRLRQAMISEEERIVIMGRLYDFYGQLLTPHRQRIYEMAVYEDLSLAEIAERLLAISETELRGENPTEDDYTFIYEYGGYLEHLWKQTITDDESARVYSANYPAALVTDIASDGSGNVLEIGTGNPSEILVIVPVNGTLRLASGAVYSFYQFTHPASDRLTDSSWRQMMGFEIGEDNKYHRETRIDRPWWTEAYRDE